jgi:hypothetical protein
MQAPSFLGTDKELLKCFVTFFSMNNDLFCLFGRRGFLSPFDYIRLSVTCKDLHKRITNSQRLWEMLFMLYSLESEQKDFSPAGFVRAFSSLHPLFVNQQSTLDCDSKQNVVLYGSGGGGKSSLARCFADQMVLADQPAYLPTIGVEFFRKNLKKGTGSFCHQICLWDTAGEWRFRSIVRAYSRGAHALIFCFNLSNPKSFEDTFEIVASLKGMFGENVRLKSFFFFSLSFPRLTFLPFEGLPLWERMRM